MKLAWHSRRTERPSTSVQIDDSRFPLITVRFTGHVTEEDFCAYLDFLDRNLERTIAAGTKTAYLFDAREVGRVPAQIRGMQATWMRENAELCREHAVGFAFVINSGLIRGLLTAILWLAPMPSPHEVMASTTDADAWLLARLEAAGVRNVRPHYSIPPRDSGE